MAGEAKRTPLRRQAASAYLEHEHGEHISSQTLAKLASIGGGPPFRKSGRWPIYDPDDLDAFVEARRSAKVRSTSELAAGKSRRAEHGAPVSMEAA